MADERPAPRRRTIHTFTVLRTERLSPHLIRVVLGGAGFDTFVNNDFTDRYVKLQFGQPGVTYPEPFDLEAIRRDLPAEQWPTSRTYTVRRVDTAARELTIDFVYHGDEGYAGPWAASARPGDLLRLFGPGGAYAPRSDVDWHLLVGDESALPAIGAAIEAIPAGVSARAIVLVGSEADEQKFDTAADVEITWLHEGSDLVAAVRAFEFLPGTVQAFVHGEAGFVAELRGYLGKERGIAKDRLSISGYWRRGKNEDGWQAEKRATRLREEAAAQG
ncbi:MAG TPA: siderophore-interacting protein [Pseudonocardiaceae bacterium]|nr:siderophore-interacting protein [Pseudonocardiaceae bacterium]